MSAPASPLGGDLTIRHATRRHAELLDWLDRAGPEDALDVTRVQACDTAGLQLLLALWRERQRQGCGLRLGNPTPSLQDTLQRCGLGDLLAPIAPITPIVQVA